MIHLFTSFIVANDCPSSVIEFYSKKLIPLWAKIHSEFFESITVVTNIPECFNVVNLKKLTITLENAFCGYDYRNLNITGTQIGAWKYFIESLAENDVGIYLDPDAFMLNSRLQRIASSINNHMLTKIVSPVNICDAGVAIIRNTNQSRLMLQDMTSILSNNKVINHIEVYYNATFKGNNDCLISWLKHSLLLRGNLCGVKQVPDTIHDCTSISIDGCILNEDHQQMLSLIGEKKNLRGNYLPTYGETC